MTQPLVSVEVVGERDIATRFEAYDAAARRRLRKAMDRGTTVQLRAVKRNLKRKRSGLTAKALGRKTLTYPSGVVAGLVGPRGGYKVTLAELRKTARRTVLIAVADSRGREIKLKAYRKSVGDNVRLDPVLYMHLIEAGHEKGRGRSTAPAYPAIRPGFDASIAEVQAILVEEVAAIGGDA